MQRPSLREGFLAVLGLKAHGGTRCAGCARSARTAAV